MGLFLMFPKGYHQYHLRFDTDIRDQPHMDNETIREYIEGCALLESLVSRARSAESTADKLQIFRELKDFQTFPLVAPGHHILEALSTVDPQAYVNMSPDVKSMSVDTGDGWKTYEKEGC